MFHAQFDGDPASGFLLAKSQRAVKGPVNAYMYIVAHKVPVQFDDREGNDRSFKD